MSDSSRSVKNFNTPFTGGASAIGFVASITVFPDRLDSPAARSASAATVPLTARTTSSANSAAWAKPPRRPFGFCVGQFSRLPRAHHYVVTVLQKASPQDLRYVARSEHSNFHELLLLLT